VHTALHENASRSYKVLSVVWNHTVLLNTRHRQKHPTLTSSKTTISTIMHSSGQFFRFYFKLGKVNVRKQEEQEFFNGQMPSSWPNNSIPNTKVSYTRRWLQLRRQLCLHQHVTSKRPKGAFWGTFHPTVPFTF